MGHKLITEVSEDGDRITLEDGSIFIITAGDISKAICWYETQRVVVTPHRSGGVRIKNLDTFDEESVRATRLTGSNDDIRSESDSDDE
jgi:hypothetical protein